MITPATAELATSIAKGLIKFAGRLDRLLAEKVAITSPLSLRLPSVTFHLSPAEVKPALHRYLDSTTATKPGPLGVAKRQALADLMASGPAPDLGAMLTFHALLFPDQACATCVEPDADFLGYLRDALPALRESLPENASDTDKEKRATLQAAVLSAAFHVDSGDDTRQIGYPVRIGALVVDVFAEFGAENTQLFVRDERLRSIVQSVLTRFAEPDLETYDSWSPLLRHVLSATLNGALDAHDAWQHDDPWIGGLVQALVDARSAAGTDGDDYLLGLLRGRGYQSLVGQALARAAAVLDEKQADAFAAIASDILRTAAPLVAGQSTAFADFFSTNWTTLVHAGLVSLEKHGPVLLDGQTPLLRDVLRASITTLAATNGANLLSDETLFHVIDAAIGVVATQPSLLVPGTDQPWLQGLFSAVVGSVSAQGVRDTFSRDGLAAIARDAAAAFASHPEWVIAKPGIYRDIVGGILRQLTTLKTFDAQTIAQAGVSASLQAIAANPTLFRHAKYPQAISDFAHALAASVHAKAISALTAADLITAATSAAQLNPQLFADPDIALAVHITQAVLRVSTRDVSGILSDTAVPPLVRDLLNVYARHGRDATATTVLARLEDNLATVLEACLTRAQEELGRTITTAHVPALFAAVVKAWLTGKAATIDAGRAEFQILFSTLASETA